MKTSSGSRVFFFHLSEFTGPIDRSTIYGDEVEVVFDSDDNSNAPNNPYDKDRGDDRQKSGCRYLDNGQGQDIVHDQCRLYAGFFIYKSPHGYGACA
jgi:hypothetical protein